MICSGVRMDKLKYEIYNETLMKALTVIIGAIDTFSSLTFVQDYFHKTIYRDRTKILSN
jgi:hypothetical protein